MSPKDYDGIRLWPLRSHLIEIQGRIESVILKASAIHHGRAANPQKFAGVIAADLIEIQSWLREVQKQHAPDQKHEPQSHA